MPFQPGQSGNPGGRPRGNSEIKNLARGHSPEAIERLAYWMRSDNAKASVSASAALLDRGWGKPTQLIAGDDDGDAIRLEVIKRLIVDPNDKSGNTDSSGVPPAA